MKHYLRVIIAQPSPFERSFPSVFTPCCGLVKCHIYNRTVYHVGFMITRAASEYISDFEATNLYFILGNSAGSYNNHCQSLVLFLLAEIPNG